MACHVRDLTPESQSPSPEPLPSLPCSPPSATRGSGEGGPSPGTWDFFGIIQPGCLALPLSAVASHLLRDQPPPAPGGVWLCFPKSLASGRLWQAGGEEFWV